MVKNRFYSLQERVCRLEEKFNGAERALKLARKSLSINAVVSVITVILALIGIGIHFIK